MNIRDFILGVQGGPGNTEGKETPRFYCSSQKSETIGNKHFVLNTWEKAESFEGCELMKLLPRMLGSIHHVLLFTLELCSNPVL